MTTTLERLAELDTFPSRGDACRFPVGKNPNGSHVFCGERAVEGQPYCAEHCRIAFTAGAPRKPSL